MLSTNMNTAAQSSTTDMMPTTYINIAACLKTTAIVEDIIQITTVLYIKATANNTASINSATNLKVTTIVTATTQIQTATHIKLSTNINTATLII